MWKRFANVLRCPLCRGELSLHAIDESRASISEEHIAQARKRGLDDDVFATWVEAALLRCATCKTQYPVVRGLPVMLPYTTPLHTMFLEQHGSTAMAADRSFAFANREPMPGEQFVRESFSTEWLEYDYDGVIWELSYADHEKRFHKEVGPAIYNANWFIEIGCGLGLATAVARGCSGGDAVGLDLSLAVTKSVREFRDNPFMHFVQASAFFPPFAPGQFDVVYSRGVLHHTFSTRKAFESVASLSKPGGTFFLWLYGPRSIWSTPLRMGLFALEAVTRPLVSRAPDSWLSLAFLRTMAGAYMVFNRGRRLIEPEIQPLNFRRAVHAARDRFTPKYAFRHSAAEISGWFAGNGYRDVRVLDWREMPPADQDDFKRNVGVRATRAG